jgi:hypothetical protein
MKYRVQFDIGYDEKHWDLSTFYVDREAFYRSILDMVMPHVGTIRDCGIEFEDGTCSLAKALVDIGERSDFTYWIAARPAYSAKDILEARFVRFSAAGEEVDSDRDWRELNKYLKILCGDCGAPDESSMPKLYALDKRTMRKRPDIFPASNGIRILSAEAFEHLQPDIGAWVTSGPATVTERGRVLREKKEYVWIRPTCHVGWYVDAKVLQTCPKCGRPTEIRRVECDDIFERNKRVVTSFQNVDAPIALVGNWFGDVRPNVHFCRNRDVIISGALHEKIRQIKLKGFVEADYVIHAADEPGHEVPE